MIELPPNPEPLEPTEVKATLPVLKRRMGRPRKDAAYLGLSQSGLKPWAQAFCVWLNSQAIHPRLVTQLEHAQQLSGDAGLTLPALKQFKKHALFRELNDRLEHSVLEVAKLRAELYTDRAIQHHNDSLEGVVKEKRYDEVPKFTSPYFDRVWPKKQEQVQATQIVIQMTPQQKHALEREAPVIEVEAVPLSETT